ncbi:MAG TPA: glycosyltransferase family 2 protein [Verrucomicrobiae bacterium]|nr:glycosyltransferase family 2 protein [Verrucomicrobiae bacterium]
MTSKNKKIMVLIPAYQAAQTIGQVFARLPEEMNRKDATYVVINDGSRDETARVVEKIAQERDRVRLVNHPTNRGYAQAQKTGFQIALSEGFDIVALLHSDGQYPPELLPTLLAPLENDEADLVQGSRMAHPRDALKGGMPLYKWLANISLTTLENLATGLKMSEYHSGYMLYSRKVLETVPFMRLTDTFHIDGEMLFMTAKKGLRVKILAIPTRYAEEKSHLKPVRYGFDVLKIMWNYRRGKYDF